MERYHKSYRIISRSAVTRRTIFSGRWLPLKPLSSNCENTTPFNHNGTFNHERELYRIASIGNRSIEAAALWK